MRALPLPAAALAVCARLHCAAQRICTGINPTHAAALCFHRYMTGRTSRGLLAAFFAAQVPLLLAERLLGALLR